MAKMERNHRVVKERIAALKRQWAAKNLPCHLCGGTIDYTVQLQPNSCEADHLTAVAAGGHVLGPMAPACRRCNQSRGAKDVETYRATIEQRRPAEVRKTTTWA